MASISITKTYDTGVVLTEADLDNIISSVETFLNTTKINDDNIQTAGITGSSKLIDATVTTAKLATDAVTTVKITDLNVTTAKINDLAVTAGKIAADAVTTAKILDSNVTTAKIADSNITTAKIADANVTKAKLVSVGQQVSASSSTFSHNTSTATDVTNLSVSITTVGRPVTIKMVSDGSGNNSVVHLSKTSGGTDYPNGYLLLLRGATEVARVRFGMNFTNPGGTMHCDFPNAVDHIDVPTAATYTYKVQAAYTGGGTGTIDVSYWKLVAYEL